MRLNIAIRDSFGEVNRVPPANVRNGSIVPRRAFGELLGQVPRIVPRQPCFGMLAKLGRMLF